MIFTGSFDLQDEGSSVEITDRLLSMLSQYLQSNQTLVLNESFQIYLNILCIEHSTYMEHTKQKRY